MMDFLKESVMEENGFAEAAGKDDRPVEFYFFLSHGYSCCYSASQRQNSNDDFLSEPPLETTLCHQNLLWHWNDMAHMCTLTATWLPS